MYHYQVSYTKPLFNLNDYPNDKVICIMPCYNVQSTIKKAIESIINQTHTNWELIIVDDASTDKSVKIIKKYLTDSRITLLQNKTNRGCYYSRNRALYYVKDKEWSFFTTHDADDISTSGRFSIYINSFYQEKCEILLGIYNGKRATLNKIKYYSSQPSVGTCWFTYSTFKTLGYYYPNRFGSDSEYKERAIKLVVITSLKEEFSQKASSVIKWMNEQYAYTYTTGFNPNLKSLTQKYSIKERKQFSQEFKDKHLLFTQIEDFYQRFEPHPEDIIL